MKSSIALSALASLLLVGCPPPSMPETPSGPQGTGGGPGPKPPGTGGVVAPGTGGGAPGTGGAAPGTGGTVGTGGASGTGGAGADAAPPTDEVAPEVRPADASTDGATIVVGERTSLGEALAARWVGARKSIVEDNGMRVFRGMHEAGKFGGPNGNTARLPLPNGTEYIFEYKIRFDGASFPFSRGGKIPGLAGGKAPTGCVDVDPDGFSARMMWREGGSLIGYIYDQTQNTDCGNGIGTSFDFKSNTWHSIKERVRLNTGNNADGILQIWADDRLVIDRKNMRYMAAKPTNKINVVLFQAFFGGSTAAWAPSRDCHISFAEPYVTLVQE